MPERGRIGIFNRSYYEEVLAVRFHPEILRNQGLSEELRDEKNIWKERYRFVVDLHHVKAYEECLNATSTRHTPWCVVPADVKENARLIVSRIVLDAFEKMKMAYPNTTPKRPRELKSIRKRLSRQSDDQ